MILLVTDTSGKNGSVALARAGEGDDDSSGQVELIEEAPLSGGTFSAQLVPQVAALLARHGLSKTDIGAFVVVSGPGSFTGLRVGLAAMKALAEILQKPIVPVSLLEAVARAGGMQGKVVAVLDAGRGEVYVGELRGGRRVGAASCRRDYCRKRSSYLQRGSRPSRLPTRPWPQQRRRPAFRVQDCVSKCGHDRAAWMEEDAEPAKQ